MALSPGQIVQTLAPIVGRVGAAGIAGNTMQESSDNPASAGGNLAQWQGGRHVGLVKYAQSRGLDPNSAAANLGYLVQDLKGPYAGLAAQLRQAKDPGTAATLFSNIYERPGTPMLGNRINYARQALGSAGSSGSTGASLSLGPTTSRQGSTTVPVTTTGFNQAGYDKAVKASVAGQYLAASPGTDPYSAGAPKTGLSTGSTANPLLASGQLTTKAPNPADYQTAQTTLQKIAGTTPLAVHPTAASAAVVNTKVKGVTTFQGKPVAKWIAPILAYAKAHGWTGTVNSGYRSLAQQTAIYNSGVRPAAKPGTSNHEMTAFPGGAVDVSNAQQLSQILLKSPYAQALVYAGSKDPVHFSHPHNGSY